MEYYKTYGSVNSIPLFPSAGIIEMGLYLGAKRYTTTDIELLQIKILNALELELKSKITCEYYFDKEMVVRKINEGENKNIILSTIQHINKVPSGSVFPLSSLNE